MQTCPGLLLGYKLQTQSKYGPQHAFNIFKHAKLNRHHFATQIWSFGTRMGSQAQVQGKMSEREAKVEDMWKY